jgi:hypothetical protein
MIRHLATTIRLYDGYVAGKQHMFWLTGVALSEYRLVLC